MTRPRYTEELLKIIFFVIGIAFIAMGFLTFAGLIGPTASSTVQVSEVLGLIFVMVGIAFLAAQGILKSIVLSKVRKREELLADGTRVNGTVEKVYLQRYTQYGRNSPYRILYSYTYQGKVYHHKTGFLWDKPDLAEQDSIVVYANGQGESTVGPGSY